MATHLDLEMGRRTVTLCPSTQFDIFTLSIHSFAPIKKLRQHRDIEMGVKFFIYINYHLYSFILL